MEFRDIMIPFLARNHNLKEQTLKNLKQLPELHCYICLEQDFNLKCKNKGGTFHRY